MIKKLVSGIDKKSNMYIILKKIYKRISKNLRNQMMFDIKIPSNQLINEKDKVLIVAPHPDDEVIACGGLIAKYGPQIDVLCINSSGVRYTEQDLSAEEIAQIRIEEFYNVMKYAHVNYSWIAKIWGVPPMFKQINLNIDEYINRFKWKEYDYIFLPFLYDGHREHRYVANHLIPQIVRKTGYKSSLKIVRYEVWNTMTDPNYFEDISEEIDKKRELINLYVTRQGGEYAERMSALNYYRGKLANCEYAEAYRVISINEYLSQRDDRSWSK